ncbi:hypothetical protein G8A07_04430 [Roseateles sp. DAIF2]|uniref:gamma-mobile-trio integrase GmtZ n=1 Tax=Roseateles sp. DAIF2 TaxID=2714952 RepID=UPI0018A2EE99|nr:integrase family protein [Roseateles sp. DAIF2]QPF72248.1 hypothetical protein G8A07_04430 [Roseateles sp. DAIF2]
MNDFSVLDRKLDQLLQSRKLSDYGSEAAREMHKICRIRYIEGGRRFNLDEVSKDYLAATGRDLKNEQKYARSAACVVARSWQEAADLESCDLDISAPPGHPDYVLQEQISDPLRKATRILSLLAIHLVCKFRFERGELDFSAKKVAQDRVLSEGPLKGRLTYNMVRASHELLDAWQGHSDKLRIAPSCLAQSDEPDVLIEDFLKGRGLDVRIEVGLRGINDVCRAKFEQGDFDFSPLGLVKDLVKAGVFGSAGNARQRLLKEARYRALVDSWQRRADAQWISTLATLPSEHPDAVYRSLALSSERPLELPYIGVHRLCYLLYKAGHIDFSRATIAKLYMERAGYKVDIYRNGPKSQGFKQLVDAWGRFARPWLQSVGAPASSAPRARRQTGHDRNLEWVRIDHPELEEWRLLGVEWLRLTKSGLSQRIVALGTFFRNYLMRSDVPKTPEKLLRRGAQTPEFLQIVGVTRNHVAQNNRLREFVEWVLLRDFSDEADDGQLMVSPAYRNPFPPEIVPRGLGMYSESVRSPLPYGYIAELRKILAEGESFGDWKYAQNAQGASVGSIGAPGRDWFVVDPSIIDNNDPDCVWRMRTFKGGSASPTVVYQMWSPVRSVAVLTKLLLPLRTSQVRLLDSGESDTWKKERGHWVLNDHPLAEKGKVWRQGVLRRVVDLAEGVEPATQLYINTNKTADQEKFGPSKGYDMPWFVAGDPIDNVFYWLEKLRNWQSKYNPLDRRTSWAELDGRHIQPKTPEQLASYPDACFLFRMAEATEGGRALPVSDGVVDGAWANLLGEFQRRLSERGETHPGGAPIVLVETDGKGRRGRTDFPLHSLRVSLITALALDGEVPFAILQKLVGHSRLIMTLYYTKPGHSRIAAVLSEASERLDARKEQSIVGFLKDAEYEDLVHKVVFNSPGSQAAAVAVHPYERNPAGWMPMHHGLCLVGGNVSELEDNRVVGGCYNGGPSIGATAFGPVPGGSRNCVRCRWFVTEPHHLPALAAHFNTIAFHFDEARNRSIEAESKLQALRRTKAEIEAKQGYFPGHVEVRQAERVWETAMKRFSDLAEDLVACWRLIERCKAVLNAGPRDGVSLVIQGAVSDVEAVFEETESELLQLSGVCKSVELYPDLAPGKAVLRRSQLLDSMLYNEGLPPMFLMLSEDEQMRVGNELQRRLASAADSQNPHVGHRKVVEIIDAGGRLSERLGIDLLDSIPELRSMRALHRSPGEVIDT